MDCREKTLEGQTNAVEPLVSVIIPVYNVLPYLREALDSVINQSYRNLEILIVDDGSTDGSGAVCDEYLYDPRVRVIHQENRGLSGARNTALTLMTGDFVAFLDSDDAFCPEMIYLMVRTAQRDDADVVICGHETVQTEDYLVGEKTSGRFPATMCLSPNEALNWLIVGKLSYGVWDKLYARHLWDNVRFPEGHVYEDMQTTHRLLERCNCCRVLDEKLYLYRIRAGSITRVHTIEHYQDLLLAYGVLEEYVNRRQGEVFSEDSIRAFSEKSQRDMEIKYSECLTRALGEDFKEWNSLWEALVERQKTVCYAAGLKSAVVHWLFRHYPKLLPPCRRIYRFLKCHLKRTGAE